MPIKPDIQVKAISNSDFHSLDYKVMRLVFSIHRDFGRFWHEKIYQNELAFRCRKADFEEVATEVPIQVSFNDFTKSYYIDLMVNNVIYELKTVEMLTGEHQKQTINYLLLTGLHDAKLINMRSASVQHRFVSTKITPEKRYNFTVDNEQFQELDKDSIWFKRMFKLLLDEWGVFLDVNLFYDAIAHFRGDEGNIVKELQVRDGARILGKQKVHMLNSNIAFKISSVTRDKRYYENDLCRLLRYTPLKAIHWINFNHDNVALKTIIK